MDTLTTAQIHTLIVEHQRIAAAAGYDIAQRRESRRAVKLYTAELARRQS
jgi:hypothetical protein